MLFNSWHFAVFLPILFILFWAIPQRYKWVLLLVASYYFYMSWNAKYIVLIAFTTLISFIAANCLEKAQSTFQKKTIMAIAVIAPLAVLFVFKYFNFAIEAMNDLFSHFALQLHTSTLNLILPVGISFYTFQTLSYVIDVYKGKVKAEKNIGIYATFISFFPQLVAGPIERTNNLLPQIKKKHFFDENQASTGIRLIIWGLFKKIVVADNLAIYVDQVYDNITDFTGCSLFIVSFFFTFQIYCDFSGYSDIARGTAKLLNIELMENFKSPYFSRTLKEFWSRWHISLSTWFRDYVYIPLGGSRCAKIRNYFNLVVTFIISGFWHGANWTFLVWGGATWNIASNRKNCEIR